MKKIFTLIISLTTFYNAFSQVTAIPDPAFEQALINAEVDSDGMVNGQMQTADALAVTSLSITSPDSDNFQYINNLAVIEAFINLESLTVHGTMIEELNVSTLVNLKYLDCVDNMLTHLDVSNNPLLEYLNISSGGDVLPFNAFTEIDLSHNPNISELIAIGGLEHIDLRNGNNNADMLINISKIMWQGTDPSIVYNTCIEVDDAIAAQTNQLPYSEWSIMHTAIQTYELVASCLAGTEKLRGMLVTFYPNPTSDVLHLDVQGSGIIDNVVLFDISGRVVREHNAVTTDGISVSGLQKGMYILKVVSGKNIQTEKIIVE